MGTYHSIGDFTGWIIFSFSNHFNYSCSFLFMGSGERLVAAIEKACASK